MVDDRRAILARRARLVAAAVAGAGLSAGACASESKSAPCLENPKAMPDIVVPEADAGSSEATEADAALPPRASGEPTPPPRPSAVPMICLSEY